MANLDPDFRPKPPENADGSLKPHCCRCRKVIKDPAKAIPVTVNWETWQVERGHDVPMVGKVVENNLLGPDCARQIKLGARHD